MIRHCIIICLMVPASVWSSDDVEEGGLFGGGTKSFTLEAGPGFLGGQTAGSAVAEVAAMSLYHLYKMYQTMLEYQGSGGVSIGFWYDYEEIDGRGHLLNSFGCWNCNAVPCSVEVQNDCPINAFCDYGICRCRSGYDAQYGQCWNQGKDLQRKQEHLDGLQNLESLTGRCWVSGCTDNDMNMRCVDGYCSCRDNMKLNNEALECQVFIDVNCTDFKEVIRNQTLDNPKFDHSFIYNLVDGNFNISSIRADQTLAASELATLAPFDTTDNEMREAFCKDMARVIRSYEQRLDSQPDKENDDYNCTSDLGDDYCSCFDNFGLSWEGKDGQTINKSCSEISSKQDGTQFWNCENGRFTPDYPDRSNCSEKWLPGLIQDVEDKSTSSYDDSDFLGKKLDEAGETGVTEYAIEKLVDTLSKVLEKRDSEMKNEVLSIEKQSNFYQSYMKNIDTLLGDQSFKRIGSSSGIKLNFGYINNSIELGKLVTTTQIKENNLKFEYKGSFVKSQAIFNPNDDQDIVFTNDKTTIIINKGKLPDIHHANGVITSYKDVTNRFPQAFNGKSLTLWTSMVDYTLFGNITASALELDVEVEFKHDCGYKQPKCVYWDPKNQKWLDKGCKVGKSSSGKTKCLCNHLTNFGLLFGGTSRHDKHDFAKDMTSKVVCGLSIALLIGTQIAVLMGKNKNVSKQRKIVEMNRNLCLILALVCFVFLSDISLIRNDSSFCTALTFINHYLWLATFCWILVEGFLVYKAIIVVFDSGNHRLYPFFIAGYGAPLVIASATLALVSILHSDEEIRCNYSNSEICHLGEPYIYFALVCPVVLVLLINGYIFIRTARTTKRTIEKRMKDQRQQMRAWLRSCLTLSVLLSIFWTMNILAGMPFLPAVARNVLQYLAIALHGAVGLFSFLNALMGNRQPKKAKSSGTGSTGQSGTGNQQMKVFKKNTEKSTNTSLSSDTSSAVDSSTTKRRVDFRQKGLNKERFKEEDHIEELPESRCDNYENQLSLKTTCQSVGVPLLQKKL